MLSLDRMQSQHWIPLPPIISNTGIRLDDKTGDIHLSKSGSYVQTGLSATNFALIQLLEVHDR